MQTHRPTYARTHTHTNTDATLITPLGGFSSWLSKLICFVVDGLHGTCVLNEIFKSVFALTDADTDADVMMLMTILMIMMMMIDK